jgi:phosphatidylethanolamine/phosphatidyl-N-methylethanolamine N-methyltransferase
VFKSDLMMFWGQLLRKPGQVVALAPSSSVLCAEMAAAITPDGGPVIELGPGTGNITRAMMARGLPADQIHAVEMNPDFCAKLRAEIPGLNVYHISAGDIATLPVENAQAVVSGLPLLSMPVGLQRAILGGTLAKTRKGGTYTQFTYGPKPPVARAIRDEFNLTWRASRKIWWNMPPARVYRFMWD